MNTGRGTGFQTFEFEAEGLERSADSFGCRLTDSAARCFLRSAVHQCPHERPRGHNHCRGRQVSPVSESNPL